MPNQQLAARVLETITNHPHQHHQRTWMSGVDELEPDTPLPGAATMCVAAHAVHLAGYLLRRIGVTRGPVEAIRGSLAVPIKHAAQRELGLTDTDAHILFGCMLPAAHARSALAQLATGAQDIDWKTVLRPQ